MLSEFDMFKRHERTVPYSTIARISQRNEKPTFEEVDTVVRHAINTEWKYEVLCDKFQEAQKKVKKLEGQMSAPKTQTGMLALEKEKEKNRILQNELDELHVKYDNTVWRLLKAEAKIREMENAKVEKVPEKVKAVTGAKSQELVAPDGFTYVKMQPVNE